MKRTNPNKKTVQENENQIIPPKTTATRFSNVIAPTKYKMIDVVGRRINEMKKAKKSLNR
jgi:hypothetical protein